MKPLGPILSVRLLPLVLLPFCGQARPLTLEEISPQFPTNMQIVWRAPTKQLPKNLWIYKKTPRIFSTVAISNAIVLASFEKKGIPKPSTNSVTLWADHPDSEPRPPYFAIFPNIGQMSFSLGDRVPNSETILTNDIAVQRAWDCLLEFGIDRSEFLKTNIAGSGLYGVFLPRQIDGIQTFDEVQGFQLQYDNHGKVLQFGLVFPNLERTEQSAVATQQQLIACIRGFKTLLLPDEDELDYFARIKSFASTRKLTVTKITLFYTEGIYGEMPTDNDPPATMVTPIAELEAIADFGNSNLVARIVSPIVSSDVARLFRSKSKAHKSFGTAR
jgi:hypothetical protein